MVPAEYRVFLLIAGSAFAGILLGAMLLHRGWARVFAAFLAAHVFAAIGLYIASQQAQDMQALGYVIMLVVFVLPATLGMALGGAGMWWRKRSTRA
ncbi:MAG: hypothetical protein EA339_12410 [Rhodobacteraceae bacterium]|nr:MAG: hypothetical protein EA339_12410 [Paracoccaceae bacterium]